MFSSVTGGGMTSFTSLKLGAPNRCRGTVRSTKFWPRKFFAISQLELRTVGPRMLPDDGQVVSNSIVHALNGELLTLYGDGSQTRSFCFVDDLIEGMICLMDDARTGETIVLAKAGRPWARLMPLRPPPAQRIPGRLSALGPLQHPEALLAPLSPERPANWQASSFPQAPSQP